MAAFGPVHAAHPLLTEDTDTQGAGGWQFEATTDQARVAAASAAHESLNTLALTHGVRDDIDVIVTQAYIHEGASEEGAAARAGWTDLAVDIKWRFAQRGRWSFALKPGMTLPTGDRAHELSSQRVTYGIYAVASYIDAPWRWLLHAGHLHYANILDQRRELRHASVAMVRKIGNAWRLVADAGMDTESDPSVGRDLRFATLGAIYSARDQLDFDLGYRYSRTDTDHADALLAGMALRW